MTEAPYAVYVRLDESSRITAINSDAFLADTAGWTMLDQGWGDIYHHAQGNYLPGPLADSRGIFRYKLAEGMPVERTAEEMEADYAALPEPEPSSIDLLLDTAADHEYRLCLMELGLTESDLEGEVN